MQNRSHKAAEAIRLASSCPPCARWCDTYRTTAPRKPKSSSPMYEIRETTSAHTPYVMFPRRCTTNGERKNATPDEKPKASQFIVIPRATLFFSLTALSIDGFMFRSLKYAQSPGYRLGQSRSKSDAKKSTPEKGLHAISSPPFPLKRSVFLHAFSNTSPLDARRPFLNGRTLRVPFWFRLKCTQMP
jgi:hypothetical protein